MYHRTPFFYATGYRTHEDAEEAIFDMYADGEIDRCDKPAVKSYTARNGKRRYGVQLSR